MENKAAPKANKTYMYMIILLMLVLPVISIVIDSGQSGGTMLILTGKWFTFWAIGVRLLLAGLRQTLKPEFTARDIFHIDNEESHAIVRELGFANLCFGLVGVISLFIPGWRVAAAFTGGLYMGIAGAMHIVKRPSTPNEVMALVSDIFIFVLMAIYIICH
jgi:hypothetical protein